MRGMLQVASIRDLKGIHIAGVRSIPKVLRSKYLELYMISKEKDRLEKEAFLLDKRRKSARRELSTINKRFRRLQKEINEEKDVKGYRHIPTKPFKKMPVKY